MKASSIIGLVPEYKLSHDPGLCPPEDWKIHNRIVDKISCKEVTLDRERLASILYLQKCDPDALSLTDTDKVMIMEESYREADAIIANETSIIVCKE